MARPRGWAATRTACNHGHPYPQNLSYDKHGYGYCAECKRIRNRAWKRENRPALGHDPVAVERAVAGEPPERLVSSERTAAVQVLTARDFSAREIAERIGCSQRTVHRARSRTAAAA